MQKATVQETTLGEWSAGETYTLLEQPGVLKWRGEAAGALRDQDEEASPGRAQPGVQEFSQVGPRMPKLPSAAAAAVPSCATRHCFLGCGSLRGCVCFEPSPC